MNNDKELMQQVLHALECATPPTFSAKLVDDWEKAVKALRTRLAELEPVAWVYEFGTDRCDAVNEVQWYRNVNLTKPTGMVRNVVPLYTVPPKREWKNLTDEDIKEIVFVERSWSDAVRKVEEKLREKNNGI